MKSRQAGHTDLWEQLLCYEILCSPSAALVSPTSWFPAAGEEGFYLQEVSSWDVVLSIALFLPHGPSPHPFSVMHECAVLRL